VVRHHRYVAFFDMLGFKSAIRRNAHEAWNALCDLRACMDKIETRIIEITSSHCLIRDRVRVQIFSDSILIFTLSDEIEDLYAILILSTQLYIDAYNKCIPLRGGIAYGEFFFNSNLNLYCGVPFVEAYKIGESALWSGITIQDEVANHCLGRLSLTSYDQSAICQWNVPLKEKMIEKRWVINWPTTAKANFKIKPPISVRDFYSPFKRLFGDYEVLSDEVKIKYENTVTFINEKLSK